jgi:phosphopantetheine--protein transferase-like protein
MTSNDVLREQTAHHPALFIGTDILSLPRLSGLISRHGSYLRQHFYTPSEWLRAAGDHIELSGVFAAKEAVVKALGAGFAYMDPDGIPPTDIEILCTDTHTYSINLTNTALRRAQGCNIVEWSLSLSTHAGQAVAVVTARAFLEEGHTCS